MFVRVSPPDSSAVLVIAEERVAKYEAQGWTRAVEAKAEKKYLSQMKKAELIAVAEDEGVALSDGATVDEIRDAIKAHRGE
jgi:hypothetical protein